MTVNIRPPPTEDQKPQPSNSSANLTPAFKKNSPSSPHVSAAFIIARTPTHISIHPSNLQICIHTFNIVRILRMRRVQRPILRVLPIPSTKIIPLNHLQIHRRPQLSNIRHEREQPPLAHERDLEPRGHARQQDAHGVRTRKRMHEEEIVFRAPLPTPDQQRRGRALRLGELLAGVGANVPCIPVIEEEVLLFVGDDRDAVFAGDRGVVVEALVGGDFLENVEDGLGFEGGGAGVGWVVEVFVEVAVEAGGHSEGFDGDGRGGEFVGVAEVNEGVGDCAALGLSW